MVVVSIGSGAQEIVRRNKAHSRKAGRGCQGKNIALHQRRRIALPQMPKL
jgi:hypothetical protein